MRSKAMRRSLKCLVLCIASAYCAMVCASQSPDFRGPPWNRPVASSRVIHLGGATIQVDFAPGELDLRPEEVLRWIDTAGRAVSAYFGKFPVARARILVVPVASERGVLMGTTWGDVGGFPAFSRMRIGQHTTAEDLQRDWTMTHELVHMGFPSLPEKHDWLEEGLATYIEAIARVQIGTLTAAKIWGDMHRDMRKGEPAASDHGLDETHTWASTYWGGALFCLMADVKIRQETGNRKGLQDALRGIVAAGGTIDHDWPIEQALAVGDRATGTSVLKTLYKNMGEKQESVDLDDLWKQLGVRVENGNLVLDSAARLARIREQITSPELHSPAK